MGFFSNLFHHDDIQGTKKYIYITGMVCQNCSKHVTEALKAVDGVGQAEVVVADSVSDDTLLKTVVNAGYGVTEISLQPKKN